MDDFKGTFTVLITPFDQDQRVDVERLRALVNWQIEEGIHGLIPLGSTGEFLSLTDEERNVVAKTVIDTADNRVPVLIGCTAESTTNAVRYCREAQTLGADGVMVLPPFYANVTEDELFHHFKTIAESIEIPVMIYNNPNASNIDMLPQTVARIAQITNVKYIKESTLEVTRVRDIIRLCGDQIKVFGGVLGFESFMAGAVGWVAVGSNVLPSQFAELYNATVVEKNIDKAQTIYREMLPVIDFVFGHRYVSGTKTLLKEMGKNAGDPRPPRLPSPKNDVEWAKRIVEELTAVTKA